MGRPQSVSGGRPHRITVALSDGELAVLDALRGPLTRSEALRNLVLRVQKAG